MQSIKNLLKKLDFNSYYPTLKIDQSDSYKTTFGGFISIALIILHVIGLIYFGKEMFLKNEPIAIISAKDYGDLPPPIQVNNNGFNFFLAVNTGEMITFIDERIYTVRATQTIFEFKEDGLKINEIVLNYDKCSKFYSSPEEISTQMTMHLDTFWCLEENSAKVQGYWGSYLSEIQVIFSKCKNTTENNNHCHSEEEIKSKLKSGYLTINTFNSILDINNKERPVFNYLQNDFYTLNDNLSFEVIFYLKQNEFSTDSSFLIDDFQTSYHHYYEAPLVHYYENEPKFFNKVIFKGDRIGMKVKRYYTKIQDVLTRIGGLSKAITIIAYLITKFTSSIILQCFSIPY